MKSFIFVFNGGVSEREKLVEIVDKIPEIYAWRYDMTSCFYLLSNYTAKEITESIRRQYPDIGLHVITKLGEEYWGSLTSESWHMLERCEFPDGSS